MAKLILASSSPRRLELLHQIGIVPDAVIAPDIDETPLRDEPPRLYAARMAAQKLAAAASSRDAFVIAADTVVALGRRILPKTETLDEARRCLDLLSGRRHRVHAAVAVRAPDGRFAARNVPTAVSFGRLDQGMIEAYLTSGEWRGKAGGYAIQGHAAAFVDFLGGSHSGVVGLPLHETLNLLRGLGWRP